MSETLRINEIFHSIQGESTWTGLPCVFVRLAGCHLRCRYCDTAYAFHEGDRRTVDEVVDAVCGFEPAGLVEVTGGEPLLQSGVFELMTRLCDLDKTVLVETSGACDVSLCDPRVIRIVDFKTPGSGEVSRNDWGNVAHLTERDEVKFVITDRADYEWARGIVGEHDLVGRVRAVLFSPVVGQVSSGEIGGCAELPIRELAEWILADRLAVRLQPQMHRFVWGDGVRGV